MFQIKVVACCSLYCMLRRYSFLA